MDTYHCLRAALARYNNPLLHIMTVCMEFKSNTDAIIQSLNMLDLGLLSLEWMFRLL